MKFNENLKYLRKQANLTQEQLAEELNVSRQAITKWESGQSMPDIENLIELSYIFSITIDSLVGDIESKSSLRINKKIDNIGWFIAPFIIVYIFATKGISNFVKYTSNNENLVFPTVASMIILGTILFIISIKKWLKEKQNTIIDLTNTNEGKNIRRKFLLKQSLMIFIYCIIFVIILEIQSIELIGMEAFIKEIIINIICIIVIDVIFSIIEYKKLAKKVKEFNENKQ